MRRVSPRISYFPILYKFETEAAFDTQMAVRDADVERRGDLHDAIVLDVKR